MARPTVPSCGRRGAAVPRCSRKVGLAQRSAGEAGVCLHFLGALKLLCLLYLTFLSTGTSQSSDSSWFQSVDSDHSGYISIKELKQALVNSNWSSFNDETCLMMISES